MNMLGHHDPSQEGDIVSDECFPQLRDEVVFDSVVIE
jgi:hypothetical protein